jgi:hypothetical protein
MPKTETVCDVSVSCPRRRAPGRYNNAIPYPAARDCIRWMTSLPHGSTSGFVSEIGNSAVNGLGPSFLLLCQTSYYRHARNMPANVTGGQDDELSISRRRDIFEAALIGYRRGAVALIFSLATSCRGCASLGGDILGTSQFGLDLFDCGEGAFELLR